MGRRKCPAGTERRALPKMDLQLISTDFDGTLFAEFENPPIPGQLVEQLARLQAAGAKWVINTGRDMSSLMEALGRARIPIEPDYLVLVEREIHRYHDSQYTPLQPWNAACERDQADVFARLRPHVPELVDWINGRFHARIYEDAYSPLCLIAGNNGDMDAIHAHLQAFARGIPNLVLVRNDVYARFSHDGYNKGTALAEIARQVGVAPDRTFAAGDHLNDLPMLQRKYAACLAAPANAVPIVREALAREGGYLCRASEGWGVAEALEHFLAA